MNKLTIPALLLGVVMVAGAFAFMPVQEASTVHTGSTFLGSVVSMDEVSNNAKSFTASAGTDVKTYTFNPDKAFEIIGVSVTADVSAYTESGDKIEVTQFTLDGVDIDGGNALLVSKGDDSGSSTISILADDGDITGADLLVGIESLVIELTLTETGANDGAKSVTPTVTIHYRANGNIASTAIT